jgi:hypothetical protein
MSAFAGRSVFAFFDALSLRYLSAGVARREAPACLREEARATRLRFSARHPPPWGRLLDMTSRASRGEAKKCA